MFGVSRVVLNQQLKLKDVGHDLDLDLWLQNALALIRAQRDSAMLWTISESDVDFGLC